LSQSFITVALVAVPACVTLAAQENVSPQTASAHCAASAKKLQSKDMSTKTFDEAMEFAIDVSKKCDVLITWKDNKRLAEAAQSMMEMLHRQGHTNIYLVYAPGGNDTFALLAGGRAVNQFTMDSTDPEGQIYSEIVKHQKRSLNSDQPGRVLQTLAKPKTPPEP
jgi:hypothetical protein